MVTGVLLAGGYSSRAKTNKLLLEVNNKPLILNTINSIKPFVDRVLVVTGFYNDELYPLLNDVDVVYNKDFHLGMFSSVLCGVKHCKGDVLILPGDMTGITKETFESLLSSNGEIRIPTYNGKTGHPLFLSHSMCELLLKEDVESNLKVFISKHENKISYVPVNDEFIKKDIDTIEDYKKFISLRKETVL